MSARAQAVFLSYASQDAAAAKRICDALRAAGVEVWFDQNELVGGDQWDAKIRGQISSCALFLPVISANTQARLEGYFRIEWKLAAQRTHAMADEMAFLLPVVIDDTSDAAARVPAEFKSVQWTRLKNGETPPAFVARVGKLLAGEDHLIPPFAPEAGGGDTGVRRKGRAGFKWWWLMPIFGMTMALVLTLKEARPPAATGPAAPAAVPPQSEARQLAERARTMALKKYNSSGDDYATAEGLVKRALELEQNDAEIWAISSLLNTSVRTRGFDHSPSRRERARRDAERALKLDPDSVQALYAFGRTQRDTEPAAAETTFKKILSHDPDHVGALAQLAWVYDLRGEIEQAIPLYERVVQLDPENAPLTRYLQFLMYFHYGRFEEADRSIRASVAVPSANAVAGLAMLELTWKGRADEASRAIANASEELRAEPRLVWVGAITGLCRRDPEEILQTLNRLQADYIQDNWFAGPKGYFAGQAHSLAGRQEAARLAWEGALANVDARLKATPENLDLHLVRGQLLAWLGRNAEGAREARVVEELNPARANRIWTESSVLIYAALGDANSAVSVLEKLMAYERNSLVGWPLTPALLRIDPRWDRIRQDPRFQKLATRDQPGAAAAKSVGPQRADPRFGAVLRQAGLTDAQRKRLSPL